MLRISVLGSADAICLQLEGSLSGRWIAEFRRMLEHALSESGMVALDLARLWFVDIEGVALLRSLARDNVILLNCSTFIAEQLKDRH